MVARARRGSTTGGAGRRSRPSRPGACSSSTPTSCTGPGRAFSTASSCCVQPSTGVVRQARVREYSAAGCRTPPARRPGNARRMGPRVFRSRLKGGRDARVPSQESHAAHRADASRARGPAVHRARPDVNRRAVTRDHSRFRDRHIAPRQTHAGPSSCPRRRARDAAEAAPSSAAAFASAPRRRRPAGGRTAPRAHRQ